MVEYPPSHMDRFAITIKLQTMNGNWVLFRGERNIMSNCLISVITAHKVLKKWYASQGITRVTSFKKKVEVSIDIIPETISSV